MDRLLGKLLVASGVVLGATWMIELALASCSVPECQKSDTILERAGGVVVSCKYYDESVSVAKKMYSHTAIGGDPATEIEAHYLTNTFCPIDCKNAPGQPKDGIHFASLMGTDSSGGTETVHTKCKSGTK